MPVFKTKNENFFKKWTPEMAYILGFFCADGAMTINQRGSKYIDFLITDKDLLLEIQKCLGSNHKIARRLADSATAKDCYRLQIGSKIIFSDLLKLGLTTNKTFRFRLPPIPKRFLSDFVRGYFDGDGNVWTGLTHKDRRKQTRVLQVVFNSGNKRFLQDLAKILNNGLKVVGSLAYHDGAYRLIYSTKPALSLYNFMYNDAKLFLARKKRVFEKYLNAGVV